MEVLLSNGEELFDLATNIIAAAAIIAALVGSPKATGWVARIRKVLDLIAFNVGNAKNAKDVEGNAASK